MSKTITKKELANFNGLNGSSSYIAFQGKIYDVSTIFVNGEHAGCKAGQDLTNVLDQSPHDESLFANFTPVGILVD